MLSSGGREVAPQELLALLAAAEASTAAAAAACRARCGAPAPPAHRAALGFELASRHLRARGAAPRAGGPWPSAGAGLAASLAGAALAAGGERGALRRRLLLAGRAALACAEETPAAGARGETPALADSPPAAGARGETPPRSQLAATFTAAAAEERARLAALARPSWGGLPGAALAAPPQPQLPRAPAGAGSPAAPLLPPDETSAFLDESAGSALALAGRAGERQPFPAPELQRAFAALRELAATVRRFAEEPLRVGPPQREVGTDTRPSGPGGGVATH